MKRKRRFYYVAGISVISLGVVGVTLLKKLVFSKSYSNKRKVSSENKPMLENPFEDFLISFYTNLEGGEILVVNEELLSTQEQDMFLYDIKYNYVDMYPQVLSIYVVNTSRELSYTK